MQQDISTATNETDEGFDSIAYEMRIDKACVAWKACPVVQNDIYTENEVCAYNYRQVHFELIPMCALNKQVCLKQECKYFTVSLVYHFVNS